MGDDLKSQILYVLLGIAMLLVVINCVVKHCKRCRGSDCEDEDRYTVADQLRDDLGIVTTRSTRTYVQYPKPEPDDFNKSNVRTTDVDDVACSSEINRGFETNDEIDILKDISKNETIPKETKVTILKPPRVAFSNKDEIISYKYESSDDSNSDRNRCSNSSVETVISEIEVAGIERDVTLNAYRKKDDENFLDITGNRTSTNEVTLRMEVTANTDEINTPSKRGFFLRLSDDTINTLKGIYASTSKEIISKASIFSSSNRGTFVINPIESGTNSSTENLISKKKKENREILAISNENFSYTSKGQKETISGDMIREKNKTYTKELVAEPNQEIQSVTIDFPDSDDEGLKIKEIPEEKGFEKVHVEPSAAFTSSAVKTSTIKSDAKKQSANEALIIESPVKNISRKKRSILKKASKDYPTLKFGTSNEEVITDEASAATVIKAETIETLAKSILIKAKTDAAEEVCTGKTSEGKGSTEEIQTKQGILKGASDQKPPLPALPPRRDCHYTLVREGSLAQIISAKGSAALANRATVEGASCQKDLAQNVQDAGQKAFTNEAFAKRIPHKRYKKKAPVACVAPVDKKNDADKNEASKAE